MSRKIILVGGLLDEPDPETLLARLTNEVSNEVEWNWVYARKSESYQPKHAPMQRLLDELRKWRAAQKQAALGRGQEPRPTVVVKLFDLDGKPQNQLFAAWPDPLQVPTDVRTTDDLLKCLASPQSTLFPPVEWWAGVTEAAIVAVLCKLIRNKSWNASVQGHQWTNEVHVLTQAPVARNDRQPVIIEAQRLLPTLAGKLLLTKGSGQGQTPKEWCIELKYLKLVKSSIIAGSLQHLREIPDLRSLIDRASRQPQDYRLDGEIVSEKIKFICRS